MDNNLQTLIGFGRKWVDAEGKLETTRTAFIDGLIAAGFTCANTEKYSDADYKAGKVSNENKVHRDQLLLICAAAIKINGKRLSDDDLIKFADDGVSNKVMLAGFMKGNVSKEVTWRGNASSRMGKVRIALQEREDAAKAAAGVVESDEGAADNTAKRGAKTTTTTKSDKDVILDHLQKVYLKTFKADIDLKCDLQEFQKDLRKLAQAIGGSLVTPKQN